MLKIGYLGSGKLGLKCLQHLYSQSFPVEFICTDVASSEIIEFSKHQNISCYTNNPRKDKIITFLQNKEIDILLSINYLYLVDKKLLDKPKSYAINLHGSLLPKYRGRTPHVWAIINNEQHTGVTAHLMDEECDNGKIVIQKKINIDYNDTGATILAKFELIYPEIIDQLIYQITNSKISLNEQNHALATYFGKRTSEDGLINWNWQKERIRNWVRAQAYPYPGAFSFYNKEKIIIDEVIFSNFGFNQEMQNGLVLNSNPVLIKSPNGVLELSKIRNVNIQFKTGEVLCS